MLAAVGDDVVDLEDPAIAATHLRARWVDRVCAPAERARVAAAGDPHALLWALYAAKEAAYKAACRVGPRPLLGHARFVVSADGHHVSHEGRVFALRIDRGPGFVHAVAWTTQRPDSSGVARIPAGADASAAARALLLRAAARLLGARAGELAVTPPRRAGGPPAPELVRAGRPSRGCLSLSHDGRFVSFAAIVAPDGAFREDPSAGGGMAQPGSTRQLPQPGTALGTTLERAC